MIFCIVCEKEDDICDCIKKQVKDYKNKSTHNSCLWSSKNINNTIKFNNITKAEKLYTDFQNSPHEEQTRTNAIYTMHKLYEALMELK